MPTRRDIYLPDSNFATVNRGYQIEEKYLERKGDGQYETFEAEMAFPDDSLYESTTDRDDDRHTIVEAPLKQFSTFGVSENGINSKEKDDVGTDDVDASVAPRSVNYAFYNEVSTAL